MGSLPADCYKILTKGRWRAVGQFSDIRRGDIIRFKTDGGHCSYWKATGDAEPSLTEGVEYSVAADRVDPLDSRLTNNHIYKYTLDSLSGVWHVFEQARGRQALARKARQI